MSRSIALAVLIALVPAAASAQAPQYLFTDTPTPAPFSPAVKVGNTLYLAGQIGLTADIKGIGPETQHALTLIKGVLEKANSDMDHVVKCTVFLADMKEWGAMNDVYKTFFREGHFPARSAFGTTGLARDARVEIECIAVVK